MDDGEFDHGGGSGGDGGPAAVAVAAVAAMAMDNNTCSPRSKSLSLNIELIFSFHPSVHPSVHMCIRVSVHSSVRPLQISIGCVYFV
jgi:hypothetical protein